MIAVKITRIINGMSNGMINGMSNGMSNGMINGNSVRVSSGSDLGLIGVRNLRLRS